MDSLSAVCVVVFVGSPPSRTLRRFAAGWSAAAAAATATGAIVLSRGSSIREGKRGRLDRRQMYRKRRDAGVCSRALRMGAQDVCSGTRSGAFALVRLNLTFVLLALALSPCKASLNFSGVAAICRPPKYFM